MYSNWQLFVYKLRQRNVSRSVWYVCYVVYYYTVRISSRKTIVNEQNRFYNVTHSQKTSRDVMS